MFWKKSGTAIQEIRLNSLKKLSFGVAVTVNCFFSYLNKEKWLNVNILIINPITFVLYNTPQ